MAGKPEHDREAILAQILPRLAQGEPLSVICRDLGFERRTVNKWRETDPDIDERMQEAKDDGYDAIAMRAARTARGEHRKGKDSMTCVQRDKLAAETDLKLLAKWDPKRYGEKLITENTNHTTVEVVDSDEMDRRLARAIAAACEAGGAGEPKPPGA